MSRGERYGILSCIGEVELLIMSILLLGERGMVGCHSVDLKGSVRSRRTETSDSSSRAPGSWPARTTRRVSINEIVPRTKGMIAVHRGRLRCRKAKAIVQSV